MGGMCQVIDLRVNRASKLFEEAFSHLRMSLKPALLACPTCFSYLIKAGESALVGADKKNDRIIKLIDTQTRNPLADKGNLALVLEAQGIKNLFPRTYMSVAEALRAIPDADIWFVKDRYGAGGKGMLCLNRQQLYTHSLGRTQVIQEGLQHISLLDERKFTARIYVFVWQGRVFLFTDGWMMLHGQPYDPFSTDFKVQIDHHGYINGANNIDMAPLSWHELYKPMMQKYEMAVKQLLPVLDQVRAASSAEEYLMLGIDTLLLSSGEVRLLEINVVPNFVHSEEINKTVNIPFLKACILRIFYQPTEKLKEII